MRSLTILEKTVGPNSPQVAIHLKKLATLYRASNRENDAIEIEKRAANIQAKNI